MVDLTKIRSVTAASSIFPHAVEFKTSEFEETETIWRLGEAHFGPQGLTTNGRDYFVDAHARWLMTARKGLFKTEADAVMMFFLMAQL